MYVVSVFLLHGIELNFELQH